MSNDAREEMIRVEGLTKVFGRVGPALKMLDRGRDREEIFSELGSVVAVHGAGFTVAEGEIFVVMGLSGSGKSTLVRCINRLIEPTRGRVVVDGEDVTSLSERELRRLRLEKVSMVFQHFSLFPHLNVLRNVAFGLRSRGLPGDEQTTRAREMLERVGLLDRAESSIDELSGGMQQRVGLARALATDPKVLLMDEPFSALDPLIRREMQDELLSLQDQLAKTIVFITHDLDEALKLGDRIAFMKDGVIEQIGTPEEILRQPATDYVADFVQGANPWTIITAEHIMDRPDALVKATDGPRLALRRMRSHGISSIFVVGPHGLLEGILTADAAAEAIRRDRLGLSEWIIRDFVSVAPDTTLEQLIPLGATAEYPLPVVDEHRRLLGIIVRSAILTGMTRSYLAEQTEAEGAEAETPILPPH